MVDPNKLLRVWMLTPTMTIDGVDTDNPILAVLASQAGNNPPPSPPIFAGSLPEKYDPRQTGNGTAVVVRVGGSGTTTGGVAHTEIPIIDPRMQVVVWAGINEFEKARTVDRAIFDWIHAKARLDFGGDGFVLSSLNQVLGQDIVDATSGLATVLSFYHLTLRENLTD
jgi:hypothetical protein